MLEIETLVRNFTSLLSQVHCLGTSIGVVVTSLFVLEEFFVALNSRIYNGKLLVVGIIATCRSSHNLTGNV